jgi:2-hydroxychromene-2-carboxylate isomerase
MSKVEFHFDFGSPNAYLAHLVIPEIEERTGVTFEYVPGKDRLRDVEAEIIRATR